MPQLTWLEMRSASELRPVRSDSDHEVGLRRIEGAEVRTLTLAIGHDFAWPSGRWSEDEWARHLSDPALEHWAGVHADETIGILSINTGVAGEVEVDSFGLRPQFIGRGLGGAFLTVALRQIWQRPITRVWLHTSSDDHPNAVRNYLARGFRPYVPPGASSK